METISVESIIATLLLLGYEKIDSSLFNNALEATYMGEDFELDKKGNHLLRSIITMEDNTIRLKDNISVNGSIIVNNKIIPVIKILRDNTNSLLIDYLYEVKHDNKKKIKIIE